YKRKYCIENDFLTAIERVRRAARSQYSAPYSEQRIDYVLRTGANWSGPIQNFRLVIDKGDADSMVSFCAEGARRINNTQYEVKKTDFIPEGDLSVLILKRLPPGQ